MIRYSVVTDPLIHLAGKQMEKKAKSTVIEGENWIF